MPGDITVQPVTPSRPSASLESFLMDRSCMPAFYSKIRLWASERKSPRSLSHDGQLPLALGASRCLVQVQAWGSAWPQEKRRTVVSVACSCHRDMPWGADPGLLPVPESLCGAWLAVALEAPL